MTTPTKKRKSKRPKKGRFDFEKIGLHVLLVLRVVVELVELLKPFIV